MPVAPPKKALEWPVVFLRPTRLPKNELQHPSNGVAATLFAVFIPALTPKKVLKLPAEVVAFGMTDAPASTPANVLLFTTGPTPFAVTLPPVAVKMREPPMLYCVAELTTLPVSVPPAVPSPLMLKFAFDCAVVDLF